jgi:hypothetical protein
MTHAFTKTAIRTVIASSLTVCASVKAGALQSSLNTIRDVFTALHACWIPPPLNVARPGMAITVRLSFKRNGEILGKPFITYQSPGATDDERLAYRIAIVAALKRCTPLPFADALGGALAGRPISIRFVDARRLKQARTSKLHSFSVVN